MEKCLDWLEKRERRCRQMAGDEPHNAKEFNASADRYHGHAEYVRNLETALDRIAFCGAGEDYRVLREIARKALSFQPLT